MVSIINCEIDKERIEINTMSLDELIDSVDNDVWVHDTYAITVLYKGKKNYVLYQKDINVHHIIPLYDGGDSHPNNLIPYCDECHKEEHKGFNWHEWYHNKNTNRKVFIV